MKLSKLPNIQFVALKLYFCNFLLLEYHYQPKMQLQQTSSDILPDKAMIYPSYPKGPTFK